MKNRIILGIFLAVMAFTIADAGAYAEEPVDRTEGLYPQTFIVTAVTPEAPTETQLVTIETVTGFMYEFYSDAGDWMPGDLCACIMDDNGTPEIIDDMVIDANYSGIAEWFVGIYPNK